MNNIPDEKGPEVLILHDEQHYVLDRLNDFKGVIFVTGKAGTGKRTLFKLFEKISTRRSIVLAPTGIAAVNVGGQTIHSFFRLPPGFVKREDYRALSKSLVKKIEMIVIDEISMVRADILDHIDQILRLSIGIDQAFGGIPMLWIGDLYQLPPVVSTSFEKEYFETQYTSPYFFSAHVMSEIKDFEVIELGQVFRQQDQRFIRLLNRIRTNSIDEDDLHELNSRKLEIIHTEETPIITLTSTNVIAQNINNIALQTLADSPRIYEARVNGIVSQSQYPNDQQLILKKGAQVMAIRNSPDKKYVNGSIGQVLELADDEITVLFNHDGDPVRINREDWDIIRYRVAGEELHKEVMGTFTQFPLKLAWAVTVHKSQGKSFDRIIIDLGRGAFENGQAYVALSRARSFEGVFLKQNLTWRDIRTDNRVTEFLEKYR